MIFDMVLLLRFGSGQPAAGYLNLSSTSIVITALGGHAVMNRMSNVMILRMNPSNVVKVLKFFIRVKVLKMKT